MSMIKVNCPSCKSPLQIAEQKLRETQGRVVCHECQHIFRLVKKSKKAQQAAPPPPASEPAGDSLLDRARGGQAVFQDVGVQSGDPVWPSDGWPNAADHAAPAAKTVQAAKKKAAHKPQKQRVRYRVPKAADKPVFADVGQKPFAFNLLDEQAAKMQVPQVSINPDPTQLAQQALQRNGSDQQNNITIHTGSLVFTVMGESQGATTTLTAPDGSKFAEPSVQGGVQVAALPAPAPQNDLNWTIAAMSALLVLIVQLVYLVLQ